MFNKKKIEKETKIISYKEAKKIMDRAIKDDRLPENSRALFKIIRRGENVST